MLPMPDSIKVCRAADKDIDTVSELFDGYRVFYGQASDVEGARMFLADRMARADSVIFIAYDKSGRGLGFVQLFPSFSSVSMKPMWILSDLFVVAEGRRGGVGQALMDAAEQHARDTDAKGLVLETAIDNLPAQALYEGRGWHRDTDNYRYELYR